MRKKASNMHEVWKAVADKVKQRKLKAIILERVDIHLVQMNALTRHRIDMNARGVCS
jgi:cAMP phosphodiesterase